MSKTALAVKTETIGLPSDLFAFVEEDLGKGVSTAQEDNLVPLIYVLQALSPQVNKRNAAYVEGAEPGSILLRNAPKPIIDGTEGVLFQPCYFSKDWVEWVPRDSGGGFVTRHADLPKEAKKIADPKNPNKVKYVLPNGNELIETRYHVGFALVDGASLPYVIPLTSSGHTISKQWMVLMNGKQHNGKPLPSFAGLYRLRTKERTNAAGTWFVLDVSDAGYVTKREDYERGKALHMAFASGEKVMESAHEEQANPDVM